MRKISLTLLSVAVAAVAVLTASTAMAATTIVVTPTATHGWSTADTRPGGSVDFVVDASAPSGVGALQLTTDATTASKAQYLNTTSTALSNVSSLSYETKQVAPAGLIADPSYQLVTYLNGGTSGFSTLVFEPYENTTEGVIVNGVWQSWDVANGGLFWSTRTVICSNGTIVGTSGGPATYTLAALQSACPSAVVAGFGVNIGTNNPGYTVETDLFNFNGTVYDFEPYQVAASKDDCKQGQWTTMRRADGSSFKNQGDCIQYVNTGK